MSVINMMDTVTIYHRTMSNAEPRLLWTKRANRMSNDDEYDKCTMANAVSVRHRARHRHLCINVDVDDDEDENKEVYNNLHNQCLPFKSYTNSQLLHDSCKHNMNETQRIESIQQFNSNTKTDYQDDHDQLVCRTSLSTYHGIVSRRHGHHYSHLHHHNHQNTYYPHCFFLAVISCLLLAIAQGSNSEPYRASANLDENVILRCVFDFPDGFRVPYVIQWEKQGIKIPIYIWYDGYPPHIGEGYEGRVGLTGQASLNLSSVRESDQGWYICRVMFLNRPPEPIKNGTWVHLDVLAPPQFRLKPPDVIYVKVGESITLPCEAIGTPTPQIVWFKDNRPLQSSANVHITSNELRIGSIQLNDIGEYRCTSRNREGSISTTTKIIIAGPAVITLPPRNLTKLEGDRVEFVCEAKALPSNVTHRWLHNGIELSNLLWMENRATIKHGTLIINPSVAEDSGRYTCEVSNGIGLPETAEAYLNIEYPARVVYSPTIQYLPYGLSGVVRCFIQASPPFQLVTWTKDRRPFDPNSTPGVMTLNNGSLQFGRVSHEHQGIYRCTPYNIHGSAEPSQGMEVLVRDPPIFTTKPNDIYVRTVNDEVSMPCDGSGQPKPNIFWHRADGLKVSRDRASLRAGNLTIKLLKKEDHGQYECILENEIASIIARTMLIVNNTTPHTPTKLYVNASYFAATVHWTANYNGGHEQTFHLSYRISDQGDAEWKTIRVPPPETTNHFTLYNLQSDTEYEFQVYASNLLGPGLPTQPIRATTKVWSFGEKIYPTDASGATYIPTVQKPSGPKPDAPKNLTLEKMAQGWVLSWLAPLNRTVAVAYYRVEYRQAEKMWQYTDPIPYDTAHLFKNLESDSRYVFRVWAYSILGVGEVSEMIEVDLSGFGDGPQKSRAITAAVVGGVFVFLCLILISICVVKVYNKRKRKLEKSYMMVTCPVNGITSYGDSPVPSKQYTTFGDGIVRQQYYDDQYDQYRDYWQRPPIGTRIVAGRSSAPFTIHGWSEGNPITASITAAATADDHAAGIVDGSKSTNMYHHDDAYYWRIRDANHPTRSIWPGGQSFDERPVPPPRRRAMKNIQYSIESGLVQPLNVRMKAKVDHEPLVHNYDLPPSNQHSARGSFRSDGSGQSQVRRPFSQLSFIGSTLKVPSESEFGSKQQQQQQNQQQFVRSGFHSSLPVRPQTLQQYQQRQQVVTNQPTSNMIESRHYKTSSPATIAGNFPQSFGSFNRELSSIRQSSGTMTSELARFSRSTLPPHLQSQLRELPSLRPIHDPSIADRRPPITGATQPFNRASQDNITSLRATIPIGRSISQFANRALSRAPLLEPVPEAIYDSAPIHKRHTSELKYPNDPYNPYQNLPIPRQMFLSSPSNESTIRRPLLGRSASSRQSKNNDLNTTSSSESSSEPFEYTRDKLLGAVEKVRSGYLIGRGSPFRHSIDDRYSQLIKPVPKYRLSPVKFTNTATIESGSHWPQARPKNVTEVQNISTYQLHSRGMSEDNTQSTRTSQFTFPPPSSLPPPLFPRSPIPPPRTNQSRMLSPTRSHHQNTQSTLISNDNGNDSRFLDPSSSSSGFHSGTMSSTMMIHSHSMDQSNSMPIRDVRASSARSSTFPSPPTLYEMEAMFDIPVQSAHSRLMVSRVREPLVEPLEMSVDDNFEFDQFSHIENNDPIDMIRWQTLQREPSINVWSRRDDIDSLPEPILSSVGRGPLSDTEIYGTIGQQRPSHYHSYRAPRNMSIDDMEARCAALREEFINFRKRQAELDEKRRLTGSVTQPKTAIQYEHHQSNSSSNSDELESAC